MLSEKQHIDDFFRRKEEAFTPDEQHLAGQWEQMQKQLADPGPGASANQKNGTHVVRKIGKFLGGLLTIAIIAILAININRQNKKASLKTTKQQATVVTSQTSPAATQATPVVVPPTTKQPVTKVESAPTTTTETAPIVKKRLRYPPAMELFSPPVTKGEPSTAANEIKTHTPDAQALLDAFYEKLKKEEDVFYIDGGRDTTITAKEGTQLIIPAHAFINKNGVVKGKVKIVLREYLKYEDILAAKLSTTSNNEQLTTGGMVHISAEQDGEAVKINPQTAITVSVPTDNYNPNMMLFRGVEQPADEGSYTTLNWLPGGPFQQMPFSHSRNVRVLNLQKVEPVSVSYGKKTTAKFNVSPQIDIPKSALIAALKERFGSYYDNIKLKKVRKKKNYNSGMYDERWTIIDSVRIDLQRALSKGLLSKNDSLRYAALLKQDAYDHEKRIKLQKHYRFTITGLGWINCDFFSRNMNPRTNLTVNLGEGITGLTYFSQLAFTRYKSVLSSYYYKGNKIRYQEVPVDEPVILVIVMVRDGNVLACFRSLNISKAEVNDLEFEPTTPEQFKQKLQSLFASQQQ